MIVTFCVVPNNLLRIRFLIEVFFTATTPSGIGWFETLIATLCFVVISPFAGLLSLRTLYGEKEGFLTPLINLKKLNIFV